MNFYYAITNLQGELWFILKSPTKEHVPAETTAIDRACGYCGDGIRNYTVNKEISQAEFETYQAFGIKEIKL